MDSSRPRSIKFLCSVESERNCITESCVYMDLGARLTTRIYTCRSQRGRGTLPNKNCSLFSLSVPAEVFNIISATFAYLSYISCPFRLETKVLLHLRLESLLELRP